MTGGAENGLERPGTDSLNVKGNISGEEKRKEIASVIDRDEDNRAHSTTDSLPHFYVCPQQQHVHICHSTLMFLMSCSLHQLHILIGAPFGGLEA